MPVHMTRSITETIISSQNALSEELLGEEQVEISPIEPTLKSRYRKSVSRQDSGNAFAIIVQDKWKRGKSHDTSNCS